MKFNANVTGLDEIREAFEALVSAVNNLEITFEEEK